MKTIFNPYLPSYEYIPDGEPRIFDGRIYIYGSHDKFGSDTYCENDYVCYSAPVDDLSQWRFEGEIFSKNQHPHKEDRKILFAPDVIKGADGRYYLYYSMAHSSRMSVAVCNTPAGRFEYLGDVCDKNCKPYGIEPGELYQFDPGIFIDDDGSVYLYSGFCPRKKLDEGGRVQEGAHVSKLASDMMTIIDGPKIMMSRQFPCPEGAEFFEASSLRKINNKYYFIYSARANGLHYATSDYPDRDFAYGGRIHSASDVGLRGYTMDHPAYPNGNTHGSIAEVNGKYYIFDHRFSNNTSYCRQGVAEEIFIESDGSIKQVECTSCGLSGGIINEKKVPAFIICHLENLINYDNSDTLAYLTQEGGDREEGDSQYLTRIQNGVMFGFKYFDFKNTKLKSINVRGNAKGTLYVTTDIDKAFNKREDYNICGSIDIDINTSQWMDIDTDILFEDKKAPLFFIYEGEGNFDMNYLEMK